MSLGKTIRGIKVQLSAPAVPKPAPKAIVAKAAKPTVATAGSHIGAALLPRLVSALRTYEKPQTSMTIRASKAGSYCPRAEALERMFGNPDKALSVAMGTGYDEETGESQGGEDFRLEFTSALVLGKAIHHYYQNEILGPMGILIGQWECVGCGAKWGGQIAPNWVPHPRWVARATGVIPMVEIAGKWEACPHREIRLIEAYANDTQLGVSGHMDGGMFHAGERIGLEIKSISERQFKELRRPLPAHVIQGTIYCHLWNLPRIMFLYVSKGWHPEGGKAYPVSEGFEWGPFKEFLIEPRWDILTSLRLARERAVGAAELYRDGGLTSSVPKRISSCKTPKSGRCTECPVAAICWSM